MNDTPNPAAHYDEVPYPSRPFLESHPDRMAVIAKLFGLNPPAVVTARILEVGCSMGNNIIPMAEVLPRAELLAIDFSQREIAEGKKTVEALGLKNVELRVADLCDFHHDRKFDFIIAHGASLRGRGPFGDIRGDEPAEYESSGRSLRTRSPVVKAALQVLADAFPCALHCEELARLACERLGRSVPADEAEADRAIVLKLLAVIGYGPRSSRRPMP